MQSVTETKFSVEEIENLATIVTDLGAQDMLGIFIHRAKRKKESIPTICLKMELCGPTLRDWIKTYSSDKESRNNFMVQLQQLEIIKDLVNGLKFLHENKIIHRDFKPENVFFSNSCRDEVFETPVKIGDFGTSRIIHENGVKTSTLTSRVGTIDYMAPENYKNSYGFTSDLYSLGLVIWEICQFIPFHLRRDYFDRLVNGGETKLIAVHPVIANLTKLVTMLTKRNPASRYQTADELLTHLNRNKEFEKIFLSSILRNYIKISAPSTEVVHELPSAKMFAIHELDDIIEKTESIKMVIVGNSACGKTRLYYTYINQEVHASMFNTPTTHDEYSWNVTVNWITTAIVLCDTAGQLDYDRLRPLDYPGKDVFLICFSIDSPDSLEDVREKWAPEIKHFCPQSPIILVGCKMDLREDAATLRELAKMKQTPTTMSEGFAMAKEIGAVKYLECSSTLGKGVKNVFDEAILAVIELRAKQSKAKCVIS